MSTLRDLVGARLSRSGGSSKNAGASSISCGTLKSAAGTELEDGLERPSPRGCNCTASSSGLYLQRGPCVSELCDHNTQLKVLLASR